MKLLITQRMLQNVGGTEMVTVELAIAFHARGHEVAIYCPRPGQLAGLLASNGIPVFEEVTDVPWRPDMIHAHHRMPAIVALAHFSDVPCIYMCHGLRPWVEQPPLHPQIRAYVTVSEKLANHLATTQRLARERVRVIPNFVNTERFSQVRGTSRLPPTRAVLFGQNSFTADDIGALEQACRRNGIELEKAGPAYGNIQHHPELYLPDFDIAFCIGRSAVEAMGCGCATIPIVPHLAGGLVTSASLDEWAAINFSPRFFTGAARINGEWLAGELAKIDPDDVATVSARVRAEFSLDTAVARLEEIYRQAMAERPLPGDDRADLVAELGRLAVDVDGLWVSEQAARNRSDPAVYSTVLERHMAELKAVVGELRAVPAHNTRVTGGMPAPDHARWLRKAVAASGLFDKHWYLRNNPDVAKAGADPLQHYLRHGAFEGRDPSPFFKSTDYLKAHPHLHGQGISPLEHLLREAAAGKVRRRGGFHVGDALRAPLGLVARLIRGGA
ncbi:glycosyltransferase [Breoghania sp.]|uniref:glycosyltransferase family 4 protein n=1 Tax=Breoghania sp. TaxID=2065378 RepID=UPI002AA83ED5|nr:glycosyltransferase [Breoghania sp.]